MEKPHTFAGRVFQKNGKSITNDYAQPEKFFADMTHCLRLLEEVPFSAIEELQNYELNRYVMTDVVRRIHKIFTAAGLSVSDEIVRQIEEKDEPFEGLEEDLKKKAMIKISGEED